MRQTIAEKNGLRTADAAQIEAVFEAKLAHLAVFYAAGSEGQGANSVEGPAVPAKKQVRSLTNRETPRIGPSATKPY